MPTAFGYVACSELSIIISCTLSTLSIVVEVADLGSSSRLPTFTVAKEKHYTLQLTCCIDGCWSLPFELDIFD